MTSSKYAGPFAVSANVQVRARAFKDGHNTSSVTSVDFAFVAANPTHTISPSGAASVEIRWDSTTSTRYDVERAETLLGGSAAFASVATGILATPPTNTFMIPKNKAAGFIGYALTNERTVVDSQPGMACAVDRRMSAKRCSLKNISPQIKAFSDDRIVSAQFGPVCRWCCHRFPARP